jgi:hypothetical protein
MASLSDILVTGQNIATAINQIAQTYLNVQGAQNRAALSTPTLVLTGSGRVAVISVTTAGSTTGTVYDSQTGATTPIYIIPSAVGIYNVNLPVNFGIYVSPGTGQVVTISFSS